MALIRDRRAYSPIIALQGPRQCGKSFLVRKILFESNPKAVYQTFDRAAERNFAAKNPESYLAQYSEADPLIIDEAQKVPDIFDALKLSVDEDRRPGRFVILGSTEFSRLTLIRESLTGRVSRIRLYPFTLSESRHLPFNRSNCGSSLNESSKISRVEMLRYLERGGFPGIFTTNNQNYRKSLLRDWLDLTVERDIHLFPKIKADSSLARSIMDGIAQLEHPDLTNIARFCGRVPRAVASHLELLESLFVISKLPPHPLGTGKPIYFLCDVSLVAFCGGDFSRSLQTFAINELLAKNEYASADRRYYYYRNQKGSIIDLIESDRGTLKAISILNEETFDSRRVALLTAFKKKVPQARLYCLGPSNYEMTRQGIKILKWESVA